MRPVKPVNNPPAPLLAAVLALWAASASAVVVEDWSGVVPWFTFTFRKSKYTGRIMDDRGTRINFGRGRTPAGERAVKLTYKTVDGGYAGVWNHLGRTVDLAPYDYLNFEVKSEVPGPVRMAVKDDRNVTYVTSFTAPSTDWVEVDLPISLFIKDRFADPAALRQQTMGGGQFEESDFQNLDPYQQAVREAGKSRREDGGGVPETPKARPARLDTRSLAAAEVVCGPGEQAWPSETAIDWTEIRTFCLSPLMTGKGEVLVGPIRALKWGKKGTPTPTPRPTATPVPLDRADVLDVLEPPANFFVRFDGPGVYQVELFDAHGGHYKTLARQRVTSQKETWVKWDGMDEQGRAAPPGRYQIELTKDGMPLRRISLVLHPRKP